MMADRYFSTVFRLDEKLAVVIPEGLVEEMGLAEGDDVDVVALPSGAIGLRKITSGNAGKVEA